MSHETRTSAMGSDVRPNKLHQRRIRHGMRPHRWNRRSIYPIPRTNSTTKEIQKWTTHQKRTRLPRTRLQKRNLRRQDNIMGRNRLDSRVPNLNPITKISHCKPCRGMGYMHKNYEIVKCVTCNKFKTDLEAIVYFEEGGT